MLVCVLVTLLITTANALEKLMLDPHNPVELKLTGKVEPMVLATPSWVTFGDIPCQYFFNEGFYSLVDYRIVNDPVLFKSQAQINPQLSDTVYFNFCQKISLASAFTDLGCDPAVYGDYFAIAVSPTQTCTPLSTTQLSSITNTTWNNGTSDLLGVQYRDQALQPLLKIDIQCDTSLQTPAITTYSFNGTTYHLKYSGQQGCPDFTINQIWEYLYVYRWIGGVICIVLGFFLGIFGRQIFLATIFISAVVISLIVILYIYFTIGLTSTTKAWIGWAVLGAAILIGVVIGLLCSKFARIGATLIALWGGFLFGILLNEAFFYNTSVGYVFWIISVAAALIMAGLVFVVYNHVVILSTSFVGAYLFVRGISLWAGGYPNEYILMKEIKSGIVVTVPLSYYFYIGGVFVVTAICAYIQYKQFRLKSLEESRPYERLR